MLVEQRLWTIAQLLELKDRVNLNPAWQRGPAWQEGRRVLLIDSILRRMDVPEIYLRRLQPGGVYDYEAVDGQQRLRTIWDFACQSSRSSGEGFALTGREPLPKINGIEINGKKFSTLSKGLRDRFLAFQVGVGEIMDSSNDEIAALFARLQMGMPLNPAELRNSEIGPARNIIKLMATSHQFFLNSRLSNARDKHFDYASYAFATLAGDGRSDIKAPNLRALQRDYNSKPMEDTTDLSQRVGEALNVLSEVDAGTRYPITRKWIFVDLLLMISRLQAGGAAIDVERFTRAYDRFEERRRLYTSEPDKLLSKRRASAQTNDQHLYDYIYAFRTEGATASNLQARQLSLRHFFRNVEVR